MTPTQYFLARTALAFGIQRRNQRMAAAAAETHLLRDAELHLGHLLWEKCEHLDEVSMEYWSIRKIENELAAKRESLAGYQTQLDAAHQQREQALLTANDLDPEVATIRDQLIDEIDRLEIRREEVTLMARQHRRTFDGLKAKLEVLLGLGEAGNGQAIAECKSRIREIKAEFAAFKQERAALTGAIDEREAQLKELEQSVNRTGTERKSNVSKLFVRISEFNQAVGVLNAEIGALQKRKLEHCAVIGGFLSHHARTHPACVAICKPQRGLIDVMGALRRSISYNHNIAGV